MTEAPEADASLIAALLPFDPFDEVVHANPYPTYQKVREENGETYVSPGGLVSVLSHQAVSAALKNPKFGWGDNFMLSDQLVKNPEVPDDPPGRMLMFMDPPDHTRVRGLVSKAFTPRTIERLRAKARVFATTLMAETMEKRDAVGVVDLHETIVSPLPGMVLSELMDVPEKYHESFLTFYRASGIGIDPGFLLTEEQRRQRDNARSGFMVAGMEMAAERRQNPGDDLVSALAAAESEGDRLDKLELAMTLMNLLAAGFGATVALITNTLFGLLSNPDQLAWFREHPSDSAKALEELTRYDTPLQMTFRTAFADTEVGGTQVSEGQSVMIMLGAANHDPEVYPDPSRLDLSRPTTRHVGFGHGIHFCVAAPIARLTAQVALEAITRHDLELTVPDPARPPGMALRTLDELPVRLGDLIVG
jgi:cytochrome P450